MYKPFASCFKYSGRYVAIPMDRRFLLALYVKFDVIMGNIFALIVCGNFYSLCVAVTIVRICFVFYRQRVFSPAAIGEMSLPRCTWFRRSWNCISLRFMWWPCRLYSICLSICFLMHSGGAILWFTSPSSSWVGAYGLRANFSNALSTWCMSPSRRAFVICSIRRARFPKLLASLALSPSSCVEWYCQRFDRLSHVCVRRRSPFQL